MAAIRSTILAARDSVSVFGSDQRNSKKQTSSLTDEVRAAAQLASSKSRFPLQPRDRNANMRVPPRSPLTTTYANGHMAHYDKQQYNTKTPSSAPARSSNRAPLTPRIASSVAYTRTTPLSRRKNLPSTDIKKTEDSTSSISVASFSANVISKTELRKPQANSTSSAISSTYSKTSNVRGENNSAQSYLVTSGAGYRDVTNNQETTRRPAISSAYSFDNGSSNGIHTAGKDSKFFFANEMMTGVSQQSYHGQHRNLTSLSYVDQEKRISHSKYSSVSSVGSINNDERIDSLLNDTNNCLNLSSSVNPNLYHHSGARSTLSGSSRVTTPKFIGNLSQATPYNNTQIKQIPLSKTNSNYIISPSHSFDQANSRSQINVNEESTTKNTEPLTKNIDYSSLSDTILSPSCFPSNSFVLQESQDKTQSVDESHNPIKTGTTIEHLNELATNARRERKVLDLEITNSSLSAINKTLERKMRKQMTELRRYKRLSRSGQFLSHSFSSSRKSSMGEDGNSTSSDLSEVDGYISEITEENDDTSEEDRPDIGYLSSNVKNQNNSWHRRNDERKLWLDLAKHQQLLASSQRMKRSIKICTEITEELIKEGQKALDHRVMASDGEFGGRVLTPDEMEDIENEGMSEVGIQTIGHSNLSALKGKLNSGPV